MAIEKILEEELKLTWTHMGLKSRLVLHCSCGHEFKIKEKFSTRYIMGIQKYCRSIVCPSCKEKDYLVHFVAHREEDIFSYGVRTAKKDEH